VAGFVTTKVDVPNRAARGVTAIILKSANFFSISTANLNGTDIVAATGTWVHSQNANTATNNIAVTTENVVRYESVRYSRIFITSRVTLQPSEVDLD
jgi:hypothetical protein